MSQREALTGGHGKQVVHTPVLGPRLDEGDCRKDGGRPGLTECLPHPWFFHTRWNIDPHTCTKKKGFLMTISLTRKPRLSEFNGNRDS